MSKPLALIYTIITNSNSIAYTGVLACLIVFLLFFVFWLQGGYFGAYKTVVADTWFLFGRFCLRAAGSALSAGDEATYGEYLGKGAECLGTATTVDDQHVPATRLCGVSTYSLIHSVCYFGSWLAGQLVSLLLSDVVKFRQLLFSLSLSLSLLLSRLLLRGH